MRRTRTPHYVNVDLYGAVGIGATRAEAKAQAEAKITHAFTDPSDYNPQLMRCPRGEVVTVYRTLDGWTYGTLWPDKTDTVSYGSAHYPSKRDAAMHARRHMARGYWDDDATNCGHDLLQATDEDGHRELNSYRRFQAAYRRLKAEGKNDTACHDGACQAMSA